jgi:hypothetical protein
MYKSPKDLQTVNMNQRPHPLYPVRIPPVAKKNTDALLKSVNNSFPTDATDMVCV